MKFRVFTYDKTAHKLEFVRVEADNSVEARREASAPLVQVLDVEPASAALRVWEEQRRSFALKNPVYISTGRLFARWQRRRQKEREKALASA